MIQGDVRKKRAELCYWIEGGKEIYQIRQVCDMCKASISFYLEDLNKNHFKESVCENCTRRLKKMGYNKK